MEPPAFWRVPVPPVGCRASRIRTTMTNLLRRIRKLESVWKDCNGLVPHTKEWLEYWLERLENYEAGDDLRGLTLAAVDAIIRLDDESESQVEAIA